MLREAAVIDVTLTPEQQLEGAQEGFDRQAWALHHNLKPRHYTTSLWCAHIEGALGELACSVGLEKPWTGKGFRPVAGVEHPPDVGDNIEVRQVFPPKGREPTLNFDANRDEHARWYVLVVGFSPNFSIVGRILGTDAQREEWKVVYPERELFRVPASALMPINPKP
jgi:hypothetical protein